MEEDPPGHQQQQQQGAAGGPQEAEGTNQGGLPPGGTARICLVPVFPATPVGLTAAYSGPMEFSRDGLLLRHREADYVLGGPTPLALLWKDAACSKYWLDTDAAGVVPEQQQVVLAYQKGGGVATGDEHPVVLARLPAAFTAAMSRHLAPGRLLRFSLPAGGLLFSPEGKPAGAELHYLGPANQRRGRADLLHKVLFQAAARTGGLTWQQLLAAAQAAAVPAPAAEAGVGPGGHQGGGTS